MMEERRRKEQERESGGLGLRGAWEENWARSNSMMNMKISMLIEKGIGRRQLQH